MELARPVEATPSEQRSVLAALRLQRKLTVQEAATKAALWPDQVEWLEEGRLYRFPSSEAAVLALLRYTTALDIDHREARKLAGLPVEPPPRRPIARWITVAVAAALLAVLSAALALAFGRSAATPAASHASTLAPPWRVTVDVLNGGGDINYTRQVATRIGSFGYRIGHVTKAARFDYPRTMIYFEPGGEAYAGRLASQLGCGSPSALPGGKEPRRLVVVTGPARATC